MLWVSIINIAYFYVNFLDKNASSPFHPVGFLTKYFYPNSLRPQPFERSAHVPENFNSLSDVD